MQTQRIHFAHATDGVSIAYCSSGSGPPLLLVSGWVSHLELDSENPAYVHFLEGLAAGDSRQLIRMDFRGSGLSSRDVEDVSAEARARDIETVVDHLGLEKTAIFAWSMGGPPAVIYAAKHPDKVSHMVLFGTFASHKHSGRESLGRALVDLIRADWRIGSNAIVEFEMPGTDRETAEAINRYQRGSASGEVAAAMLEEALFSLDVSPAARSLTMPTLVLHRRDDQAFPSACGRELASLLPHAHFVPLPGNEHPPFYGDTDAVVAAVDEFLSTADGHAQSHEGAEHRPGMRVAPGLQIILFTDMEGSTGLTQRLGDEAAQELVRTHNSIVREALQAHTGAEIKHTGDGIMASFQSASGAVECALEIQRAVGAYNESKPETPIHVRIGLNAGEPVAEDEDLFGTAVQLTARIAARAEPGQVLVSDVVRQLAAGKGFLFADEGNAALRGFEDPVRLFGVRA